MMPWENMSASECEDDFISRNLCRISSGISSLFKEEEEK